MLIEGAISITVAIAAAFMLPNWANNTPWLDAEMTEMAQYRLVLSAGGHDEADSQLSMWAGFKLAIKDWFSWLFMILHFTLLSAQSFKDFLPSIVSFASTMLMIAPHHVEQQIDDLSPSIPVLPPRLPRHPRLWLLGGSLQGFGLARHWPHYPVRRRHRHAHHHP
jgi:hypothetical protein